jgi:septum formation protein
MLPDVLKNYKILLASKSPRRQQLLRDAGISFAVVDNLDVDESFPNGLDKFSIPVYLAEKKADAYFGTLSKDSILISADTIVWLDGSVINKPIDRDDAISILSRLSNNRHEVITGVSIRTISHIKSFYSHSEVFFGKLSRDEITYYVDAYKPYDKAGAYGVQEWIGYIGIERINGSFYNVMGLPIHKLYRELEEFAELISRT